MTRLSAATVGEGSAHIVDIEGALADSLRNVSDELAHAEGLEPEKRAEIYSILQAIETDSAAHRQIVGMWVSDAGGDDHV